MRLYLQQVSGDPLGQALQVQEGDRREVGVAPDERKLE